MGTDGPIYFKRNRRLLKLGQRLHPANRADRPARPRPVDRRGGRWPLEQSRQLGRPLRARRAHYWRLVFWTLFRRPRLFPLAIYGFHFRQVIALHVG